MSDLSQIIIWHLIGPALPELAVAEELDLKFHDALFCCDEIVGSRHEFGIFGVPEDSVLLSGKPPAGLFGVFFGNHRLQGQSLRQNWALFAFPVRIDLGEPDIDRRLAKGIYAHQRGNVAAPNSLASFG